MQKINSKILAFLLFFMFLIPREGQSAQPIKTILIFFSWNSTLPGYQKMLEGFYSTFSEEPGVTCNLVIEYLDLNRPNNEMIVKTIVDMFNDKYKNIPIDLLIIVGPDCYPALKTYGLQALKNTPTICIEVDEKINDTTLYPDRKNTIKLSLNYDFYPTVKNALALFPDYKNAYVINGSTPFDIYVLGKFKKAAQSFEKDITFRYISNLSIDSLLLLVEKIPRNTLLFIPSYFHDKNDVPYSTTDATAILARRSSAPVLPMADIFNLRKGALGGYVYSFRRIGMEFGRIANLLLHGTPANNIKVHDKTFYEYVYDWEEVKRWGLTKSTVIPSDSIFYFKPSGIWREYRWYILAVFLFLAMQSVFIIYLVRLNKSQKETTRQRTETQNIYQEMVREDRLLKMAELTASLSHELNQPLTAILYNAQAGKRFLKSGSIDPKRAEEIFDYIIEDDKRAGGIISSVKNLMKLDNREKENLNAADLIRETVDIFKSETIRKNVTVSLSMPEKPARINGEKILLQQVILNFFRNAMNAMENNPPENKLLKITLKANKSHVTVSIRDSGIGIDPEIKEKLFKPFITGTKKGFGIGLALSRTIIEKHNGEIWAENPPEGGAEFCFRLKAIREE